jgi:transcriptional regulator with XRE-family HTH domain
MKSRTLGERLAQERREKSVREWRDVGHQEIADAVGISQPTYSRYESDSTKPDDETLGRLAAYFGTTRAWLRFAEGDHRPVVLKGMLPKPKAAPTGEDEGDHRKRGRGK